MTATSILQSRNLARDRLTGIAMILVTTVVISFVIFKGFMTLLNILNRITINWSDLLFLIVSYVVVSYFRSLFSDSLGKIKRKDKNEDNNRK